MWQTIVAVKTGEDDHFPSGDQEGYLSSLTLWLRSTGSAARLGHIQQPDVSVKGFAVGRIPGAPAGIEKLGSIR